MFNKNALTPPSGRCCGSRPLRHWQYVKISKKDYDKTRDFLILMLFNEIFDEKSYKMAIYKPREKVYNKTPEWSVGSAPTLYLSCTTVHVFCEISILWYPCRNENAGCAFFFELFSEKWNFFQNPIDNPDLLCYNTREQREVPASTQPQERARSIAFYSDPKCRKLCSRDFSSGDFFRP